MVSIDDVFSVVALFILFRETVEASIICGVLLQFLDRSKPRLKRAVWWGIWGGVLTSVLFGVIFVVVFYVAKNNLFAGHNKDWFKGVICWLAAALISYLGFKMFRFIGWEEKWKRKLTAAAAEKLAAAKDETVVQDKDAALQQRNSPSSSSDDTVGNGSTLQLKDSAMIAALPAPKDGLERASKGSLSSATASDSTAPAPMASKVGLHPTQSGHVSEAEAAAALAAMESGAHPVDLNEPTRKEWWNIFFLVWVTVTREGVESVVLLGGVGVNVKPQAIPLAGFVGITAGVLLGVFLFYTGKTVKDLKYFLIVMAVIVLAIAAGQVSLGTDALIRAGLFGYCSIWIDERPWYMQPVWDWSKCCSDRDDENKFFALLRAIFGYQDKPSMLELTFYWGYWFIVLCVIAFKLWQGSLCDADFKYKQEQKKLAKKAAAEAAMLAGAEEPLALPCPEGAAQAQAQAQGAESVQLTVAHTASASDEGQPLPLDAAAPTAVVAPKPWWRKVMPSR